MRDDTRYERVKSKVSFLNRRVHFIALKTGREVTFWDAKTGADRGFATMLRWYMRMRKLVDASENDFEEETFRRWFEHLEEWVQSVRRDLDNPNRGKIKALRAKAASTTFPEEAKSLRAKADELERRVY